MNVDPLGSSGTSGSSGRSGSSGSSGRSGSSGSSGRSGSSGSSGSFREPLDVTAPGARDLAAAGRLAAGRLSAWASAWLGGACAFDVAVEAATAGVPSSVRGLPGERGDVPLGWALTALRTSGATAVRLLLPVPGDLIGVPADVGFRRAVLERGAAVIAVAAPAAGSGSATVARTGAGIGLVPEVREHGNAVEGRTRSVTWSAYPGDKAPTMAYVALADADRGLRDALRDTTEVLLRLDVARWSPAIGAALIDLRRDARRGGGEGGDLPPGYPTRARDLLERADQLDRVVTLATADPGATVSAAEVAGRRAALGGLAGAIRTARLSAYNCYGVEPGRAR